jgi:hypothetical protein
MRLRAATTPVDERAQLLTVAAGLARCQGARRYRLRALTDLTALDRRGVTLDGAAAEELRSALAVIDEPDGDDDVERARSLLVAPAR